MVTVARNQLKFTRHFRLVNDMEKEVIESVADTNHGSLVMFYYFHCFSFSQLVGGLEHF
jgi:hypothetical protein